MINTKKTQCKLVQPLFNNNNNYAADKAITFMVKYSALRDIYISETNSFETKTFDCSQLATRTWHSLVKQVQKVWVKQWIRYIVMFVITNSANLICSGFIDRF